jgi:hypothetical protein
MSKDKVPVLDKWALGTGALAGFFGYAGGRGIKRKFLTHIE